MKKYKPVIGEEQVKQWQKLRKEFRPHLEKLNYEELDILKNVIDLEIADRNFKLWSDEFDETCKRTNEMFNSFRFTDL